MLTAALTFKHEKTFMRSHSSYQRYFVKPSLNHQVNGRLVKKSFFSICLAVLDYRCKQTFSPVLSLLDKHRAEQILYATNKTTNNNNIHTSIFFIVAPCILIYVELTHQQMHFIILKNTLKFTLKYT